ncbi:MAG: ATP synthase F1 subunit delta [Bacteroidales bacterium]
MNQGRVSVSYARALLGWALDQQVASNVYSQSEQFMRMIESNPEFYQMLHSPMISRSKKEKVIENILSKVAPDLIKFVHLIVKKQRESVLKSIILVFQRLYRQKFNIIKVNIESISELSQNSMDNIASYLRQKYKKDVEIGLTVNPELIGGFTLTIEDKYLDKSIRGELELLRKKILGIEY